MKFNTKLVQYDVNMWVKFENHQTKYKANFACSSTNFYVMLQDGMKVYEARGPLPNHNIILQGN